MPKSETPGGYVRVRILISAVVMQMCLGATYSWSVYVQPLKASTGLDQGPVQFPFSLFYFAFPATMIGAGALLARTGPRMSAMGGGILFGGGWLLASLGRIHFAFTVLGIGLLAGIGVGIAYIVPITVCIRWFPQHKGLVTGVAVAGFGGGAALVSQLAGGLIQMYGLTPFDTFAVLGAAFLLLTALAGLSMQNPPDHDERMQPKTKWISVVKQKEFQVLFVAMFTGLAAGFAVNANLKEFYGGTDIQTGLWAVSLFAVANALGRIAWGFISDRMRNSLAIRINLGIQALVLLTAWRGLETEAAMLGFAVAVGFNYGGVLVIYVSSVASIWGNARVPQIYGMLFAANIAASLSPVIAGLSYDLYGHFLPALMGLCAAMLMAALWVGRNRNALDTDASIHRNR